MLIKSKQIGIMVQHNSKPRFQLDFGSENPQEVDKEVADFLMEHHEGEFEIVEKGKPKKEKKGDSE